MKKCVFLRLPPPHTHTSSVNLLIVNYLLENLIRFFIPVDTLYKRQISE